LVVQQLIEYMDMWIERRMVGQVMSSGQSADSGMGGTSGPAEMAKQTKHQLLQADAEELEETLTGSPDEPGLCSTIQKWTYPGTIDKFRVRFRFMVDDPDPKPKIDAIVALSGAGVEFGQDSARKLTGEPAPKEGEKVFGGKTPAPAMPGAVPGKPGAAPGEEGEDEEDDGMDMGNGKANGKPFGNNGAH
jgi:phage gp29-like protein